MNDIWKIKLKIKEYKNEYIHNFEYVVTNVNQWLNG